MGTGSHNPTEYNGFKMVLNKHSFFSKDIKKLQSIVESNKLKKDDGTIIKKTIINEYIDRNLQNISINKKIKIAWDISNGAMGVITQKLISKLEKQNLINDSTFAESKIRYLLNQAKSKELSKEKNLVIVCGHYGGVDLRFID